MAGINESAVISPSRSRLGTSLEVNEAPAVVIPTTSTHRTFRLSLQPPTGEEIRSVFNFLPGEKPMPPSVRARSVKALRKMAKLSVRKEQEERPPGLFSKCPCFKKKETEAEEPEEIPDTALSPELQKANNEGWNMIKTVAFPSIPALLQDLWVYLELFISILAFVLGIYGTVPVEDNFGINYTHIILASINMVMALIDGYIYFVEVGSCARAVRYYKNKFGKKNEADDDDDDDDEARFEKKTCCKPEVKEKIFMFFELGRNVITELLLYPLLILDLFGFEINQTYSPSDILGRIDYGLFIIGSFYLILAVYIMRLLVLFGSVLSLIRLPTDRKSSSGSLLFKFSVHAIGQIFVHIAIVIIVGTKINAENSHTSMTVNSTNASSSVLYNASPFLWVSIVLGWLLPLAGTAAFFIVNYYWMREFSIDFWLNMISLLQGASFAETVFGGDGISETKDKTLEFVEKTDYKKVLKQLEKYKSPNWWIKFFYPARVPVVALCGLLYDICLIAFIVSLIFTNHWELILLKDDIFTGLFFVAIIIILVANAHILFLLNSLLMVLFLLLTVSAFVIFFVFIPVLIVYVPIMGVTGYYLLLKHLYGSVSKKKMSANADDSMSEKANLKMKECI